MKQYVIYLLFFIFTSIQLVSKAQSGSGWDWSSTSGVAAQSPGKRTIDVTIDAVGNTYATGRFLGSMTLGSFTVTTTGDGTVAGNYDEDAFLVKYNANGAVQWLKKFGTAAIGSNQLGQVVTTDADGNVYIGGSGLSGTTINSAFMVKYDANGNLLWSKTDFPLYEINGINISPDGNPIVMESNQGSKNIYKFNKTDGSEIWKVQNTSAGSNSTTTYKDFLDANGNVYYTCFNTAATTAVIAGESITTTGLSSFIASLSNAGAKRWVNTLSNVQIQLAFTVDKNGKMYIGKSGGGGGTFQGYATSAGFYEMDNLGMMTSTRATYPFESKIKVKDNGIYAYTVFSGGINGSVTYGDYNFRSPSATTTGLGIVIKYDPITYKPIWANSFEVTGQSYNQGTISVVDVSNTGKVVVGGYYGTSLKFGSTLKTATTTATLYPVDMFVAQFDDANVALPPSTTWTGSANNMDINDANNWSNGLPNGSTKSIIPAGISNYPNNITTAFATSKLEVAAGATIALPIDISIPLGIINNGAIELKGSGYFYGGFNTGQTLLSGTGKIVIKSTAISYFGFVAMDNSIEINCTGTVSSLGGTINGSLFLTNGILGGSITLSNPNATVTGTATSYVTGSITRAVNTSGSYSFPVGSSSRYAPIVLSVNAITGTQKITASFTNTINGSVPNTTASGQNVTLLLNTGIWTITPDVALTGGSYNVTLEARGFTNSVTDATRYVVLKRTNSSSAWAFLGNNGTATYSSTVISATAGNITGFSDFAIGIAATSVPATLPVSYISFTAQKNNAQVILQWQTAQEINNQYFNVQQSNNAIDWQTIGKVNAGNNIGNNSYQFTHLQPSNGINYYRLQQIDRDGKSSLSDVRGIDMTTTKASLKLYPNPAITDNVTLDYGTQIAKPLSYRIIDYIGRIKQTGNLKNQQETINLSTLSKGKYTLIISDGQIINLIKI